MISAARRNFDASNFGRDINNARTKGLFNKGTGKDAYVLSYYGQNYVDILPNRDQLKTLKAKGSKAKKCGATKKAAKK